jgi:MSHA biogenesis protein MshQ
VSAIEERVVNRLLSPRGFRVLLRCLSLLVLGWVSAAHGAGYTASITTAYPQRAINTAATQVTWASCNSSGAPSAYMTCDDGVTTIMPIGFTFSFGGVDYNNWSMSSNGVIFFETNSSGNSTGTNAYQPANLPTTTFGGSVKAALMPFWADLQKNRSIAGANDVGQPTGASFYQYETQTLPSGVKVLVIQLKNVQYWNSTPTLFVNMQVQLWSTGEIVYSYGAMQAMTSNPNLRIGLQYPANNGCNTLANSQSTSLSNESFVYKWDPSAAGCTTITTPHHYEIRHDGAATLCAEPVTVLACSSSTSPCPTASIINTQIITAQLSVTGTGVTNVTQNPASFNIQPSAPLQTVNLTWASGSSGTAALGISPSVAATAALRCTNVAGTTAYGNCNMSVSNTSCIPPPNHYQIIGPASSTSCSIETFTIKAWADAAETTPYTAAVATGTLTASVNPASIPNLGAFTIPAGSSTVSIAPITFPAAGSTKFDTTATPVLPGATTCKFGSSTSCTLPVAACAPSAFYRFDESGWSGAANEVLDSSGNAQHASLYKRNSPTATVASYPTEVFSPNGKKCSAAYFAPQSDTGVNSSIKTPIVPGDQGTVHFWYKSDQAWSGTGAKVATLFDASTTSSAFGVIPFFLAKGTTGALYFFTVNTSGQLVDVTGWKPGFVGFSYPAGEWHHIALTWDFRTGQNSRTIYVDGVAATSTAIPFNSAGIYSPWNSGDSLYIGDTRYPDINVASAYDGASGIVDEFYYYPYAITQAQIIADKDAAAPANCGLHHIQIEQASNTGLTCTPSTLTIKACADATCSTLYKGGVTGTLSATSTPTGATISWVGGSSFSTDASGSTTKSVQVTTAAAMTFGASVTTPSGVNSATTTCKFGTATDCKFTAATAGFVFDVPNHVADDSQSMSISAVKQSDSSLACAPAFASVSKTVQLTCAYVNPATGNANPKIGGASGVSITCGTKSDVTLNFDNVGKATTTVQYADVGQMSLTANYTGASGTAEAGLVMNGSGSFIAAPKDFAVVAGGSPYIAGKNFSATVTARNKSGDTTPNFGKESAQESAKLTFSRCQPNDTGASAGIFTGSLGSFASGVASGTNLNWTEVGNGDVVATLTSGNYLSSGVAAATGNTGANGSICGVGGKSAGNVGAFRPAYFDTIVTPGCGSFTYAGLDTKLAGQPFTVTVKAKRQGGNANDSTTTENYAGDWAKAVTLSDANGGSGGKLTNGSVAATKFTKGVGSVAISDNLNYTFTSKTTSPYTLVIRAVDADSVSSKDHTEGSTEERSGRLRLSNAYGSVSPLYMPVEAQYWSGQAWVKNTADSCSSTTGTLPPVTFAANPATDWTLTPNAFASGVMGSGGLKIEKTLPGATTITASVPAWLKWTWGGVTDPVAPYANANVGIYGTRESRKAVHARELY